MPSIGLELNTKYCVQLLARAIVFLLELGNTARSIYWTKSEYQFDVLFQK